MTLLVVGLVIGFFVGVCAAGIPLTRRLEALRDQSRALVRQAEDAAMRARRSGL